MLDINLPEPSAKPDGQRRLLGATVMLVWAASDAHWLLALYGAVLAITPPHVVGAAVETWHLFLALACACFMGAAARLQVCAAGASAVSLTSALHTLATICKAAVSSMLLGMSAAAASAWAGGRAAVSSTATTAREVACWSAAACRAAIPSRKSTSIFLASPLLCLAVFAALGGSLTWSADTPIAGKCTVEGRCVPDVCPLMSGASNRPVLLSPAAAEQHHLTSRAGSHMATPCGNFNLTSCPCAVPRTGSVLLLSHSKGHQARGTAAGSGSNLAATCAGLALSDTWACSAMHTPMEHEGHDHPPVADADADGMIMAPSVTFANNIRPAPGPVPLPAVTSSTVSLPGDVLGASTWYRQAVPSPATNQSRGNAGPGSSFGNGRAARLLAMTAGEER